MSSRLINSFLVFVLAAMACHAATIKYSIILRSNFGTMTLWDGNVIAIYGFAPSLSAVPTVPAKILYANEGDTVILNARSVSQGNHHSIHLHGLDVDTRNDGDPATSFSLSHQQDTTYTFIAEHAGTYLYHCHVADVVHVQMGMYGLIVVRAANGTNNAWTGGPAYDKEYPWLMSEVDKAWHDSVPVHNDTTGIVILPPYRPNYFLVNGKSQQQLNALAISGSVGEKIYMRLANIGFYNNRVIFPSSLNAVIIDSDGRPLSYSVKSDSVEIMPGERYGVILTPFVEFTDSIAVQYINMNTGIPTHKENVSISIKGFVGIAETNITHDFLIYPNPASDLLHVDINVSPLAKVQIINGLGEVVSSEAMPFSNDINTSKLQSGLYFLQVIDENNIYKKKFTITK